MSRIPPVDPASAFGSAKLLLDGVNKGLGMTPNLFRVVAQSPAALEGLVGLFDATAKGRLDARTREAVALAVSQTNGCDYCLSAHSALAKKAGLSDKAIAQARSARSEDRRLQAALHLARSVVEFRGRLPEADLADARRAGLTHGDIIEVIANVALTTFTNYINEAVATDIDFPIVRHGIR